MGSAILTLILFIGIMLVLRSLILGVIPFLLERRRKKAEEAGTRAREEAEEEKE